MRKRFSPLLFLLFGLGCFSPFVLGACGPIQYTSKILDAKAAIASAHSAKTWKYACFEYYSAITYYQKAKEEAGFSDYEAATIFAEKARQMAAQAQQSARVREVKQQIPPVVCQSPRKTFASYATKKAPAFVPTQKQVVN